ncbi:MAG TPA: zinc ribbon domain-containing protein, partial [Kofleriaceae bacterium]
ELAPDIIAFLASKLDYRVGTIDAKLKLDKVIDGRITYLRLAGGLDNTFPRDKVAEGLEGVVIADLSLISRVEPAGAAEWRSFIQQVSPLVEIIYFTGVPPVFLEKLCRIEDLGTKAQVVDFQLPYTCAACGHASLRTIEVAEHRALLKFATAPELPCPQCKAAMQTSATEAQMLVLPGLPMPVLDTQLAHKLAELRMRKLDRKPSTGLPQIARTGVVEKRGLGAGVWALAGAVILVLGVIAYVAFGRLKAKPDPGPLGMGPITERSAPTRPGWIGGDDHPGHARCGGSGSQMCVGISQPLPSQEEAENEASDAAAEQLAAFLYRGDPPAARAAALAAVERDPLSSQAKRDVAEGRRAVAKILKAKASARYFEAYDSSAGKRYVAFAQVTMSNGEINKLLAKPTASAYGATLVDFPPELAWQFPQLDHGALVTKLEHGPLQELGLAEHYVVLGVDGKDVVDAAGFAKLVTDEISVLSDKGGTLRVRIQPESGEPRELSTQIPSKQASAHRARRSRHRDASGARPHEWRQRLGSLRRRQEGRPRRPDTVSVRVTPSALPARAAVPAR